MAKMHFQHRMSDADALMWHMEKDPLLRSTITVVWLLDRAPDRARLENKIERATRAIPRLRERVVSNPWSIAPPRWEGDPHFDPRFHVRWLGAPGDGSLRALLDLAQPIAMQGFDRARPLWEFYVVDGLQEGRSAMVMKLHHSLSDGVGLVRMTTRLVELGREADPSDAEPLAPLPPPRVMGQGERLRDALSHEWRRQVGRARRVVSGLGPAALQAAGDPIAACQGARDLLASVGRLMQPVSEPMSPLMRGRSLSVRFDRLVFPLEGMRAAAKRVGGKVNDAFVAGVAGGLGRYHAHHGRPVHALRMSMPINLREGEDANRAGNQFVPVRFPVPTAIGDPLARIAAIRDLVSEQRAEPAFSLIDDVAGLMNRLPLSVSTAVFGSMLKGIDFVTSNVPGPRFDVYVSGSRVETVVGFGPLAGAGVNITLFSYGDQVNLGVNTDPAAIPDTAFFVDCLQQGLDEVLSKAG